LEQVENKVNYHRQLAHKGFGGIRVNGVPESLIPLDNHFIPKSKDDVVIVHNPKHEKAHAHE
jgi:hypothetical protein